MIAPSFGDIFSSSAVKNGLLPARVAQADVEVLLADLQSSGLASLAIDLPAQTIVAGARTFAFEIDAAWKQQLMNGWDDVDLTLNEAPAIAAFWARDEQARPWAAPRRGS